MDPSSPDLEQELIKILRQVQRWNAVLLFDEAEIFMEQRGRFPLTDRLVCTFLRILERFVGLMLLTTNNVRKIDNAVWSRIDYMKQYPKLSHKTREQLWKTILQKSGQVDYKSISKDMENLGKKELNGREIKSVVKTALVLATKNGGKINSKQLLELIDIRSGFKCIVEDAMSAEMGQSYS